MRIDPFGRLATLAADAAPIRPCGGGLKWQQSKRDRGWADQESGAQMLVSRVGMSAMQARLPRKAECDSAHEQIAHSAARGSIVYALSVCRSTLEVACCCFSWTGKDVAAV